jgi:hypothetical protein
MKNSAQILSHLQHQPQFSKLSQFACVQAIQKLFPPHLQKLIRFGYIRNGVVFFVFAHPGAKQEFDIIAESIKTPLKAHSPASCCRFGVTDIKGFVTHKPAVRPKMPHHADLHYPERSHGAFANSVANPKLHAMIEAIRGIIHDRTD